MKILIVFDHPRRASFCGAVLDQFCKGLEDANHTYEIADLYRESFDPRMTLADEPDWADDNKVYSQAVLHEQDRISRNDALAFVFPVWWWSVPAMTKGWIDRVWNNGWAYGARKLPHASALMIGTALTDAPSYAKRGYDQAMQTQLIVGMMNYCGIARAQLELLHMGEGEEINRMLLQRAFALGRNYFS